MRTLLKPKGRLEDGLGLEKAIGSGDRQVGLVRENTDEARGSFSFSVSEKSLATGMAKQHTTGNHNHNEEE
jgi:hypothetical protein